MLRSSLNKVSTRTNAASHAGWTSRLGATVPSCSIKTAKMRPYAFLSKRLSARPTSLPWSDYLRIVSDRRDIDAFKRGIEQMTAAVKHRVEPEFVLAHARRADREGAPALAEAVAQWAVERAASDGDKEGRWAAVGDLGRILERAGRLDEAVKVWRDAFDEGSRDPDTAGRLSMQLERAKDYAAATAVIRRSAESRTAGQRRRVAAQAAGALRR